MWWCAELVYPGRFFDRYALLGDDIADKHVAKVYVSLLDEFQVKDKSVISDKGAAKFAKRFRVKGSFSRLG